MRTNTIFTYALYVALALLITVAGYKACQMKQEQSAKAQEQADLDQRLQELGYVDPDTTSEESSAFVGEKSAGAETTPSASSGGIEYTDPEPSLPQTEPATKPSAPKQQQPVASKPATTTTQKPAATTKPATTSESPKPAATKPTAVTTTGKYLVVTGSFTVMDNARDEMEALIKSGYLNAEVRKFNAAYATVIALRTNDRKKADAEVAKLRSKGYPGAYVRTLK